MRKQCVICNVTFDLSQFIRDGQEHAECNGCNCFQKVKPVIKAIKPAAEVKETCRTEALEKRSVKNKELLGAFAPKSQTLCRCYRCGRISATTSGDFKISTSSETGYSYYCYTVCKGRRG
ncbi:hypothetical protein TOTORO_00310 [Serratia phage vB_SmaS-Totoro]|nr:hypothetical protein TOTORO_00310 [Serratia phage vB_SmaS-Totoro]